jgi:tetratricopeptide (TPR) repeat protein
VVTSQLFNWVKSEAQYKRFRLELHDEKDYRAVGVNSGNADTDVYLCWDRWQTGGQGGSKGIAHASERLAEEATLRMFFEAESQICRDFHAFKRFHSLVKRLRDLHKAAGSTTFDRIHSDVLREIDEILAIEPSFLTMQVLRGIIACQHRTKSVQVYEEAYGIFNQAIKDANTYYQNRKRERRRAWIPSFFLRAEKAPAITISKATMQYTQGLSEVFKARIFAQNAHRFGKYDESCNLFLKEREEVQRDLDKGIRLLGSARNRLPLLGRFKGRSMTRIPLAYQVSGFLHHCHDFFDKDEVFFRNPADRNRTSDAVVDLDKAIKVYSKGIALCGKQKVGGAAAYSLHTGTRIHNNCGFTRLYRSLIGGKLSDKKLIEYPDFQHGKFNSYYSAFECETFYEYPFANLGLAYAMEGKWDLAWMAGVAALSRRVYLKARELRPPDHAEDAWIYTPEKLKAYEQLLIQATKAVQSHCPTIEQPFLERWTYVEGLSELSYSFIFRSLCEPPASGLLDIGLVLHERALRLFVVDELKSQGEVDRVSNSRIKNIMTNLVRAFWHFDNRTNNLSGQRLDTIHRELHREVSILADGWAGMPPVSEDWELRMNAAIDTWIATLRNLLQPSTDQSVDLPCAS